MSFGFDDESNEQRSNPIRRAIYASKTARETDNILYFAATGNDGANRGKVMFPAKHELVIPIYGTDARGVFLDSLHPTVRRDGSAVFGTLARDVPL
ncbi:serine-type endopeptidase-like protein 2 [Elsinoe australis]|uniref:Serine-type endopeptidase-like protein 2 n=1 Tax=Elsinoe australis TaxID=40998 RepID=A0A4U7AMS3_9PEZI|nr:serine-type endopeptidase-like protein 2 [Elsinoe australis]